MDNDQKATADHLPSLGAQLLAGRENLGLSIREVADALQLLPQQVEALESDNYQQFKADIFVKGHIRSYARLINKNPEQLLTLFENKYSRPEPKVHVAKKPQMSQRRIGKPKRQHKLLPVIVGVFALVLVALILWLAFKDQVNSYTTDQQSGTIVVDPIDTNVVDQLVVQNGIDNEAEGQQLSIAEQFSQNNETVSLKTEQPQLKQSQSEQPVVFEKKMATAPPVDVSLTIKLSDNCWLKVSDSDGKVLALGMKPKGETIKVTGKPPYQLVLGDATAVTVVYQGENVALKPNARNKSARLSVGSAEDL